MIEPTDNLAPFINAALVAVSGCAGGLVWNRLHESNTAVRWGAALATWAVVAVILFGLKILLY